MASDTLLGRLDPVDLREIWISEATSFTPWLARPENLAALGSVVGIDLELEAQERPVGPFRADILCKDRNTNAWVLIENQLERTDHGHLGQLLTYASGLDAVTIIWLAATFTEEHRAALDWLNKITDESFRFFGLEVELWRIGNSPAAPKFNVVSKPNAWSHSIKEGARALEETELSETKVMQRAYWANLNDALKKYGGPISGNKKPQPQSWMTFPIGHSKIWLGASTNSRERWIKAELYLTGAMAKSSFRQLLAQKDGVEHELGYPLEWEELPEGTDSRISVSLNGAEPDNKADWSKQHEWLAKHLSDLHRIFVNRVRALKREDPRAHGALGDDQVSGDGNASAK